MMTHKNPSFPHELNNEMPSPLTTFFIVSILVRKVNYTEKIIVKTPAIDNAGPKGILVSLKGAPEIPDKIKTSRIPRRDDISNMGGISDGSPRKKAIVAPHQTSPKPNASLPRIRRSACY